MTFEKDQKVRVTYIENEDMEAGIKVGDIGIIDEDCLGLSFVIFEGTELKYPMWNDQLELVGEAVNDAGFKVGDILRIIEEPAHPGCSVGDLVKVVSTEVAWSTEGVWGIHLKTGGRFWFANERFEKPAFRVGDRVLVTKDIDDYYKTEGKLATIVGKHPQHGVWEVDFDEDVGGHSCDGKAKGGCGLYVKEEGLSEVPKNTLQGSPKTRTFPGGYRYELGIDIDKVHYSGNKTILWYTAPSSGRQGKVIASCHPGDVFNEEVGLEIAVLKALQEAIPYTIKMVSNG